MIGSDHASNGREKRKAEPDGFAFLFYELLIVVYLKRCGTNSLKHLRQVSHS